MVSKEFIKRIEPLLFPVKLYELAHSKEIQSIKWSPDGAAVQLDVGKIRKECLETKIFNVKDYRHVFRQLSYYGFQRTQKINQICEFFHPLFNARRLDLVKKLKRSGKKNRNLNIASLAPFIERRTSSRLQSAKKSNQKNPSASKYEETESDLESSDDYQSTVAVKRRRRKVNRKRRVKKLHTAADENVPSHVETTIESIPVNGDQNPSPIVEEKPVNGVKDERDFRNKKKRTRRKRKWGRLPKKCPSRHATRDKNTVPKNEDTLINTVQKNEYTPLNTVPKNGDTSFGAQVSASHYWNENDVQRTSKENLKISPIKINTKRLTNNSSCYTPSVNNNNNKTTDSESVNSKQSSIFRDRLQIIQRINARNTDIYGTSRTQTNKNTKLDHVKLKNDSNTLPDKTSQFFDTTIVNDSNGVNHSCGETSDFKFRIVSNRNSKNFMLGNNYKWMSVKKEIDSTVEAVNTGAISSTSRKFSSFNEFSTYNRNQKTNNCTSEVQVVPSTQNNAMSTQSTMSVRSRCHAGRRKRVCTNANSTVISVSNIVNNSSTHIDDSNSFFRNSNQSLQFKKQPGLVASFYSDSSNKLKPIQSNEIAALEQIAAVEINDENSDISKETSCVNVTPSIEYRKDDFSADFEDHPSPTQVDSATSSDDFGSDGFSPVRQACGKKQNSSSSTQRDCSETEQTNGESSNTQPNSTLPPDNVEVEINISHHQKEKLVQRLYLQFKMGEIHTWDLLESENPINRFVAYDVLTLDVEKARGHELNFIADNNHVTYHGMSKIIDGDE